MDKLSRAGLQPELKGLISQTVALWGQCLRKNYGENFYREIEDLRLTSKKIARRKPAQQTTELETLYKKLRKKDPRDLHRIALAFGLMLELINRCETVYRTHRLKLHAREKTSSSAKKSPYALIYVLTAHPTEARSEEVLKLFKIIEKTLERALESGFEVIERELNHHLQLALNISIVKVKRPTVEDEALSIYRYALSPDILNLQCDLKSRELTLHFRSWVGGDKDGHPGVDEKTLLMSLNHSRAKILDFVVLQLDESIQFLELVDAGKRTQYLRRISELKKDLTSLPKIGTGDGRRIASYKVKLLKFMQQIEKEINQKLLPFEKLENLLWIYPALVLPLEIREDSEIVLQSLSDPTLTIARMVQTLKDISHGFDPRWYVRGFVLSMCEEAHHLEGAAQLLKKVFGTHPIPVVPLFENYRSLTRGEEILASFFKKNPQILKEHLKDREGRFEIMLGYSDSSKENGVLASRVLIYKTLASLDKFLKAQGLTPVFFHGSGGSIERGGGSIRDQISWWPESALNIYKVTIQGEMVARTLASRTILEGQVQKILSEFTQRKGPRADLVGIKSLEVFSSNASQYYKKLVASDSFWDLIEASTPYDYLDRLKIGSRPSKRSGSAQRRKLRAIPWVLCWTQVRLLLPTWWGVGSAWKELAANEKLELIKRYRLDPFLQSFAKSFGFTLSKIELGIFNLYLQTSKLSQASKRGWLAKIEREYHLAREFLSELTGEKEMIWERPWLAESISLRSPSITPLNLIQMIALEQKDDHLLRESVTGIATGMLTTG